MKGASDPGSLPRAPQSKRARGSGQAYRRGSGSWAIRFRPAVGARKYMSGFPTKEAAEEALVKLAAAHSDARLAAELEAVRPAAATEAPPARASAAIEPEAPGAQATRKRPARGEARAHAYGCGTCGVVGHNTRGHHAWFVATSPPVPDPTFVPPPPISAPDRSSAQKTARCSACGEKGHRKNLCPTIERAPAPPRKGATPAREIAAGPELGGRVVTAGMRFVVAEELREEDPASAGQVTHWWADEVWIATKPTGRAVDGYDEWWLAREGDAHPPVRGFPQLHPFFPCARTAAHVRRTPQITRGARENT